MQGWIRGTTLVPPLESIGDIFNVCGEITVEFRT